MPPPTGGERAFDGNAEIARGVHGFVGQPGLELAEGLLARVNLKPLDGALAAVGLFNGSVEDPLRGAPDVASGAVAFNEWNDWMVRNSEFAAGVLNCLAAFGQGQSVIALLHVSGTLPSWIKVGRKKALL